MTIGHLWLSPIGQRRTDRHDFEQSLHKGGPDFTMTSKTSSIQYFIPTNLLLKAKLESGKSPTLGTCWPPNSGGVACQPLAGSVEQTERLTPDLARTEDLGNAAPRRHCPVKMLSANNYRVQYYYGRLPARWPQSPLFLFQPDVGRWCGVCGTLTWVCALTLNKEAFVINEQDR